MRALHASLAAALLAGACTDPAVTYQLTLAADYDYAGVGRVFPDGLSVDHFRSFYGAFEGLALSGGRVMGRVAQKGRGTPVSVAGTFAPGTGRLELDALDGALSSSVAEHVDGLGGDAEDLLPMDGVADEISGFLHSLSGTVELDAIVLAVARLDGRPTPIEDQKVAIRPASLGQLTVQGSAGAAIGSAGVEVFAFQLGQRAPAFVLGQARDDGSFSIPVEGLPEDVFLLRARVAGRASDARFFRAQPD